MSTDPGKTRANLLKVLKSKSKELTIFHEIGKALTSTLDIKEIMNIIMAKVNDLLEPENWSLLLVDDKKKNLVFEIVVGNSGKKLKDMSIKIGEGIAGWVAKTGEPLLVADVSQDKRFTKKVDKKTKFSTESVICVPLKSRGKILGVIELINRKSKQLYDESDLLILLIIADYAAIALENAKYVQKVQELTITDDLTKLYNSRYLHDFLDLEMKKVARYGEHLSIIFMDLDYFKQVNDTYGHLVGSQLLVDIAKVIRSKLRDIDFAARYGGDEFVIVLSHTNKKNSLLVAKRIRKAINDTVFLKSEGLKINITASYGIASIPEDAENKVELIKLADQAMYAVKASGRDNIKLA
jgi:diguanylate cyclase (GGDEF)-like protein